MRDCNLSFANMYCWQSSLNTAWVVVDGFLIIRFSIDGGRKIGYMQPIGMDGSTDFAHIIPQMAEDAHLHGQRFRVIGVTKEGYKVLKSCHGGLFALHSDPSYEDYIYERVSLSTLSGKRLQPKRNHINQFLKRYPEYQYRPLSADQFTDCLKLDCRWREAHGDRCQDITPERAAMLRAFENFEVLGLQGGALYVEGRMVAFTYGSQVNHDTFCVHVEKGDADIAGCYTIINKLFSESLSEEFVYINREEDLGIEGLRRAKLSYYPALRQEKYTAIYLHQDERWCKELWQRVFHDDDEFIDEFIQNHYSLHQMLCVEDHVAKRYLSMLHIIPFEAEAGRIAYIYGVATDEDARNRGLATKLMQQAMEQIAADGSYQAALLIPSEEWLREYYARFGFSGSIPTTFDAYNNFDFGSGDTQLDIAMICPVSSDFETPKSLSLKK